MARRSNRWKKAQEPKPDPWAAAKEGLIKLRDRTVRALVPLEFDPMDLARTIYSSEYIDALAGAWKYATKDLYFSNTFFSVPGTKEVSVWLGWLALKVIPPDPSVTTYPRQVVHDDTVEMVGRVLAIHHDFQHAFNAVDWFNQKDDVTGALYAWPQLVGLIGEARWGTPRAPRYPLSDNLMDMRAASRVITSALILPEGPIVPEREAELGIRVGGIPHYFRREAVAS